MNSQIFISFSGGNSQFNVYFVFRSKNKTIFRFEIFFVLGVFCVALVSFSYVHIYFRYILFFIEGIAYFLAFHDFASFLFYFVLYGQYSFESTICSLYFVIFFFVFDKTRRVRCAALAVTTTTSERQKLENKQSAAQFIRQTDNKKIHTNAALPLLLARIGIGVAVSVAVGVGVTVAVGIS